MLARLLAGSVVLSWPASLAADELPSDGALNGKADDFVTGGIVALLIVGLLAAGWLRPLWAVLVAVLVVGVGVSIVYDAVRPTDCPAGFSGMDCEPLPTAVAVLPGLGVVLIGWVFRSAAGLREIDLLPR